MTQNKSNLHLNNITQADNCTLTILLFEGRGTISVNIGSKAMIEEYHLLWVFFYQAKADCRVSTIA